VVKRYKGLQFYIFSMATSMTDLHYTIFVCFNSWS